MFLKKISTEELSVNFRLALKSCVLIIRKMDLMSSIFHQFAHRNLALLLSFGARACVVRTGQWSHRMEFLPIHLHTL